MNTSVDTETATASLRPYSSAWYEHYRRALGDGVCHQLGIYEIPDALTLSVVIPVYNEERTLRQLVERVAAVRS
jgi:cellulose synthase/poly-beta-1,6-N-acetylglucosamine synthase-like glycosyltransferase